MSFICILRQTTKSSFRDGSHDIVVLRVDSGDLNCRNMVGGVECWKFVVDDLRSFGPLAQT